MGHSQGTWTYAAGAVTGFPARFVSIAVLAVGFTALACLPIAKASPINFDIRTTVSMTIQVQAQASAGVETAEKEKKEKEEKAKEEKANEEKIKEEKVKEEKIKDEKIKEAKVKEEKDKVKKEKGNKGTPAQSSALTGAATAVAQIQNLVDREIQPRDGANLNATLSGVYQHSLGDGLSVFTVSGVSRERHDGFTITSPTGSFEGAAFESSTYGLTAGTRWDASNTLDVRPGTLIFGGFGNFSSTDLKVGGASEPLIGEGEIRSYAVGGYSLINARPFYILGIASQSWAHADLSSAAGDTEVSPDSAGYIVSGNIGTLLPAGEAFLDLRLGTSFTKGQVDDYKDGAGATYTDGEIRETSGSASAKLLFTEHLLGATLKPFVQAGVTQRFDDSNQVLVDGVPYSFDDADLSVFGRIGVDISHGDTLQSYIAVRGEKSEDREGLAGQVGFTLKLE